MLSARTIYGEIFDSDEAFGMFCSIAASGEVQGGRENGTVAALVPVSRAGLAAKIAGHGAAEDKHGRIFAALLRLAAAGHGEVIRAALRAAALAEIALYRDVSLAVMAHLGRIGGWPRPKAAVLAAGIRAGWACGRPGGWRRMVALRWPARRGALGGPVPAQPGHA